MLWLSTHLQQWQAGGAVPPLSLALAPLPPCPQSRQLMSLKLEQGRVTLDQRGVTRSSGGHSGWGVGSWACGRKLCWRPNLFPQLIAVLV